MGCVTWLETFGTRTLLTFGNGFFNTRGLILIEVDLVPGSAMKVGRITFLFVTPTNPGP